MIDITTLKRLSEYLVLFGVLISFGFVAAKVAAQTTLRYPIPELGYCRDAKECYLYCEIPENKPACWSYGKYVLQRSVLGQHTEEEQAVSFPIEELGNCASAEECREYCNDPDNREACTEFARSRGIGGYDERNRMLEAAKEELGCTSMQSCQEFCEQEENREQCMQFALRHAPPEMRERIQKLRQSMQEHLGCSSFSECEDYCNDPENIRACQDFAMSQMPEEYRQKYEEHRKRALELAEEHGLPCGSFDACRQYCEENPDSCEQFTSNGSMHINIHEEKSCSTEEECRRLCGDNPDMCPGFEESGEYQRFLEERERGEQEFEQRRQDFSEFESNYEDFESSTSE